MRTHRDPGLDAACHRAWIELNAANTEFGGTLSGSSANAVYFTRVDMARRGAPTPLPANVKVSGAKDAVNFDGPVIAVDAAGSGVHVAYTVGTNDATDIVVASSSDGGHTWGAAVKVNDDAPCATHFHPALALDHTGRLYVFWYDNRDGREGDQSHAFFAKAELP